MDIISILIFALAVNAIVDIWRDGVIFSGLKAWVEVKNHQFLVQAQSDSGFQQLNAKILGCFTYVLLCAYCLSFWVSLLMLVIYAIGLSFGFNSVILASVFAIMKIANLINDFVKKFLESSSNESDNPSPEEDYDFTVSGSDLDTGDSETL